MGTAGHVTLRGWCSSTNAPASSMTQGSQCEIENHSWNAHKLGHELGGPTSLEPRKMLLWFEVEDTGCGKLLVYPHSLFFSHLFSLPIYLFADRYLHFQNSCLNLYRLNVHLLSSVDPVTSEPSLAALDHDQFTLDSGSVVNGL